MLFFRLQQFNKYFSMELDRCSKEYEQNKGVFFEIINFRVHICVLFVRKDIVFKLFLIC